MKSMKKSKKSAAGRSTVSKASKKKTTTGKTKTSMKAKSTLSEAKPFPPSPRPDFHAAPKSKKTRPSLTKFYEPVHDEPKARTARTPNSRTPIRQPAREIHLHARSPESRMKPQNSDV